METTGTITTTGTVTAPVTPEYRQSYCQHDRMEVFCRSVPTGDSSTAAFVQRMPPYYKCLECGIILYIPLIMSMSSDQIAALAAHVFNSP